MNIGNIAGGTHAGWRRVTQAHPKWMCCCNPQPEGPNHWIVNPGYLAKCACGKSRPN